MNRSFLKERKKQKPGTETARNSSFTSRNSTSSSMHSLPEDRASTDQASTSERHWSLLDGRPRGDSTASETTSLFAGRPRGESVGSTASSDGGTATFATLRSGAGGGPLDAEQTKITVSGLIAASVRSVASLFPNFQSSRRRLMPEVFQSLSHHWIPGVWDDPATADPAMQQQQQQRGGRTKNLTRPVNHSRSWKRRIFLILTEPQTSVASALFFVVLVITISLMNVIMIIQTIPKFQFTPMDCRTCGGAVSYVFDDDDSIAETPTGVTCVCPPTPVRWTVATLDSLVYFFTVEWCLRVLTFEPPKWERAPTVAGFFCQWFNYLTSTPTVLDALAIFPYYIEASTHTNGLMSLRLLRLFRVFQLVRLGSYNETFMSLTAVLFKSVPYLKLLFGVLLFGAAFFGSMMYWLEKGDWKYWEQTGSYEFIRLNQIGMEEISPFASVPQAFWWFFVTATSVGYGDVYPTTSMGKFIATFAMLTGVLVIAFPVSVFSELWSAELHKTTWHYSLDVIDEDEDEGGPLPQTPDVPTDVNAPVESARSYDPFAIGERQESDVTNGAPIYTSTSTRSATSIEDNEIVLRKDDLIELLGHIQTINESQKQIRGILRKYHLQESPTKK